MDLSRASDDGGGNGAGSVEPTHRCLPQAQLFGVLSLLWILPSAGAVVILGFGPAAWMKTGSWSEGLRAVRFEQWIALAILAMHPVFVWLAWRYRRAESVGAAARRKPEAVQNAREPD